MARDPLQITWDSCIISSIHLWLLFVSTNNAKYIQSEYNVYHYSNNWFRFEVKINRPVIAECNKGNQ